MKTLYFDCSSGISGNMTLGALLEIIQDDNYFLNELDKLNLNGYKIEISKKIKNGITGTYVDVILESENTEHKHKHEDKNHTHEHRHLKDINNIIDNSNIDENAKQLAKRIFLRVAKAEAKVHNKSIERIHFHEVGAIDSIIDIVGTAILINKINPEKIISSTVNDGYGFIECAHGLISVPVPATSEIFASSNVKFKQIDIDTELVTPTGAAIIAEIATQFITLPEINIEKIGWGSGSKELKIPNLLKVYYGEIQEETSNIVVMETNIDDCSGEVLGYTMEKLLKSGALDVFYTPVYMKKNRPSYVLSVICKKQHMKDLENIIFKHTTSIGVRYSYQSRTELPRQKVEINTKFGKIEAKKVIHNNNVYVYPEYESIKQVADNKDISIKDVYNVISI